MKVYIFCHIGAQKPNGGVKVLFEYASALRKGGWDAAILIPGAHLYPNDCPSGYKPSWFETDVPVYDDVRIVKKDDIVVIHEEGIWCFDHLIENTPRMFMIHQGLTSSLTDNVGMDISYTYAKRVYDYCEGFVVISPYIAEGITSLFGVSPNKIFHIENPIDDYFTPGEKENTILVMNKQPGNVVSQMLLKIFKERYSNWNIKLVENMTHRQVAEEMGRAKIFAFLCTPLGEGSALPPMEAALSGCKVIGYSGIGSRYYFNEPIFTEVDYNDVVTFVRMMDYYTKLYGGDDFESAYRVFHKSNTFHDCTDNLREQRSKQNFIKKVNSVFKELISIGP